jgi:RimJ/RimL family protein N-acetyltransferase
MLIDKNYSVMIAETDDNALAVCYVYCREKTSAEIGICLNPVFRGQRLSLQLLEAFTAQAQTVMGFRKMRAEVKLINLPSRRLFARAGYQIDATTKDVIHFSLNLCGQEAPRPRHEDADLAITTLPLGL